jgi:hypothetical protein
MQKKRLAINLSCAHDNYQNSIALFHSLRSDSSTGLSLQPEDARMDPSPNEPTAREKLPVGQRLFDNMYLLLALGLLVMLVVFTAWGMWEVLAMPKGTLP